MSATVLDGYSLLHRGSLVLARMERNGLRVDTNYLAQKRAEVASQIRELETSLRNDRVYECWRKRYGDRANLGSVTQLAEILFKVMDYPYPYADDDEKGRTRTGRLRADETTVSTVNIPFVRDFQRLTKLKKLKSTYLDGLHRETVGGYFHPVFNLHTAQTYRSSSGKAEEASTRDLNFQNLPVRIPEYAEAIRRCIIPRKGRRIVESDFGALEFKIAACFWKDPAMVAYASDPTKDIHRDQAMDCYLLEKEEVSKDSRYAAKNKVVFPLLYGSYYVSCAPHLWEAITQLKLKTKVTEVPLRKHLRKKGIRELGACDPEQKPVPGTYEAHVRDVQYRFMDRFPVFAAAKDEWYRLYRSRGWFPLMTGFICRGLYSKNDLLNYPIQGPGFHCLLWTIIKVQELLDERGMKTKLLAQIHDCVIADVPEDELQDYLSLVKYVVEVLLPKAWKWIIVPLAIEAEVAEDNWYEKKPWVEKGGVWQLAA